MKHFTIQELTHSTTAIARKIDNTPSPIQLANLQALVAHILDPAREALGVIHVNSGFRCATLNPLVGGAKNSQHITGEAADIELGARTPAENAELFDWIAANCEFDQLINEHDFAWVHVSFKKNGGNRNQIVNL